MLGKTNIMVYGNSGSGGDINGEVILPAPPGSISSIAGDKNVTLNLSYTSTSYITGVEVRYKTGGYPANATDGTGKTVTGTPTSINITGLTNGETYYFRLFLYREVDGEKYFQTSIINAQATGKPDGFSISINPAVQTASYMLIDKSASFNLTIPQGHSAKVYLIGGGFNGEAGHSFDTTGGSMGKGGKGGNGGTCKVISIGSGTHSCITSIGGIAANTSVKIGNNTYNSNDSGYTQTVGGDGGTSKHQDGYVGKDGIATPIGVAGSSGGGGGCGTGTASTITDRENDCIVPDPNDLGYGVAGGTGAGYGGNGAYRYDDEDEYGETYRVYETAEHGGPASKYGNGGGGGGGGHASGNLQHGGSGGAGSQGCAIFELI